VSLRRVACADAAALLRPSPIPAERDPARSVALSAFQLSLRDVEDLLAERGVDISYKTIRRWVTNFGTAYAEWFKAGRPKPVGRWHLDEIFVSSGGRLDPD
jgi:transposase-like protein